MVRCFLDKSSFLRALSHQNNLVERRSTLPILCHSLVSVQKDQSFPLTLHGTDLGMSLVEALPARIEGGSGEFTVPIHTLYEIVRKLPDGPEIELVYGQDNLDNPTGVLLRCGTEASYTLNSFPAQEFPKAPEWKLPFKIVMNGERLYRLLQGTRFAMSQEEARYYLNGLYVHVLGNQLRFVSTDSHRLALYNVPLPEEVVLKNEESLPNRSFNGMIIGRKTVAALCHLLEEVTQPVTLSFSEEHLEVTFGNSILHSPLIVGNYPDYLKAIPQSSSLHLSLNVSDFAKAIDRLEMVTADKSRVVQLSFNLQQEILSLSAQSQQSGFGEEKLPIRVISNENSLQETFIIGFNPRYLLSVCNQIKSGNIDLFLKESMSPALFKDPTNEEALYVVMPTRMA
jgi:DNA polymerase III subunit beta